jgi:hypothetical protein
MNERLIAGSKESLQIAMRHAMANGMNLNTIADIGRPFILSLC